MKTKHLAALTIVIACFVNYTSRAATITAAGSGNWTSTVPNAPWPGGVVPQPTDNVDVETPNVLTVDSTATIDYITGTGTVTLTTNSTLTVVGSNPNQGTFTLGTLNATANGCTVINEGNAFFMKHTDYYNLTANGFGNFYTGDIGQGGPPININGNLVLGGTAGVQQGNSITVLGNLTIGPGSTYDSSCSPVTVIGNTTISGKLTDGCGNTAGLDDLLSNVTVTAGGTWSLGDVVEWAVSGNLTNLGTISGISFSSITFTGIGKITGNPISIPTAAFDGTNEIDDTITYTTNFPAFNGTLQFDLSHPGGMILASNLGQFFHFNGTLNIVASGALPSTTHTYQLFDAPLFDSLFTFGQENLPTLPSNYLLVDNIINDGTLQLIALGLTATRNGNTLTLSWDSTTFPGFSVQMLQSSTGPSGIWTETGSGSVSPYVTTIDPAGPPVFYRLHQHIGGGGS